MSLPGFHVMTKPIGPLCNLDCAYCFYLKKEALYPGKRDWRMSPEVLEQHVRQTIQAHAVPEVQFAWQGGEPTLLGVDFFRHVVALQRRFAGGKRIHNALQTNGVLLDDEWCAFLAEHGFLVGLSLDGPRELHDRYRVDRGGAPSFDRAMRGLEHLKRYRVEFNTLTVVNSHNGDHPLAVYRFLKEAGSSFLQFIPAVEREGEAVAPWSVGAAQFGRFLVEVFDEWVVRDVGRVFVQLFDVALESWLGLPQGLCLFRPTCGAALALEHNGDLYSCDHFVNPENRLGNILENPLSALVNSPQQGKFGRDKADTLPGQCRRCEVRFACHGECPRNRFLRTGDGEPGLNYLCEGYLCFFRHVDPYMRFMAAQLRAGRPPALVMGFAPS
ncbi:MAG: anaerobic sulfatase maturase [Candidatus Eremiobacterota bacterium]